MPLASRYTRIAFFSRNDGRRLFTVKYLFDFKWSSCTTLPYCTALPSSFLFSESFCFFSISAAWCRRFSKLVSLFAAPPPPPPPPLPPFAFCELCLAAFQNCFWAEYRFMGHILMRQSRNFFGGLFRLPASGHTTVRSSTKLLFEKINDAWNEWSFHRQSITRLPTYPSVLRNPHTLPSAYSDTISPKCRKLAEPIFESFIFGIYCFSIVAAINVSANSQFLLLISFTLHTNTRRHTLYAQSVHTRRSQSI